MNNSEINSIAKELGKCAILYGHDISREKMQIFINIMVEFIPATVDSYVEGIRRYTFDQKNRVFPSPAALRPYILGIPSDEDESREISSKIVHSVQKFGWTKPQDARNYIGEIGWHCVERFGGWMYICENLGVELQLTTFQAQIRDLAKSTISLNKAGYFDEDNLKIGTSAKFNELESRIKQIAEIKKLN